MRLRLFFTEGMRPKRYGESASFFPRRTRVSQNEQTIAIFASPYPWTLGLVTGPVFGLSARRP